ncbi:MAG: glycerophosphodiester phosphodiesterase family protein [Capsulimonadales bacterium]|nr:glycerophosphodiester phosphodiesterase family protein [Capsulimonadales bacterium]
MFLRHRRQTPSTSWPLAKIPQIKNKFVVVAHRGDHTAAPENTLTALRNAKKCGADYMEIDLRTTRDGRIVLMHDDDVDRMTDGKGPVASMTLKEIKALRVIDRRPNLPPDAVRTETVPTFEEALDAARRERLLFYLDCKEIDPKQVLDLLVRYRMEKNVVVYDGVEGCRLWKKTTPDIPVMTSFPGSIRTPEALEEFWRRDSVEILDGGFSRYTPEMVVAAHSWGAVVWPDIQNPNERPAQWEVAVRMGVKGLQSDHPGALVSYLKSVGKR